ncbi:MAG: ASKHA domain-containing protein [Dehalococcoidales bacterium]|nr:ASKHA domain-containing protein [Dehalococcoidales bacterium]
MSKQYTIKFLPSNRKVVVTDGDNLLRAAMGGDVHVNASCGGAGSCGKCRIIIEEGWVEEKSSGKLTDEERAQGYVLACQSTVRSDLVLRVPVESQVGDRRILDRAAAAPAAGSTLSAHDWEKRLPAWTLDPPAQKLLVAADPPSLDDSTPDAERLRRELVRLAGKQKVDLDYRALKGLPSVAREQDWQLTCSVLDTDDRLEVLRVEPGDASQSQYAFAVDLGTTTISVALVDLRTGDTVAQASDYNSQVSFGDDVITRIIFAGKGDGQSRLQKAAAGTINGLMQGLLKQTEVAPSAVTHVTLAGNTTMTHLFLGIDPKFIRLDPYTPAANSFPWVEAREVGLELEPGVKVHCSSGVASYVGGDITAGVLASGMFNSDKLTLFLDIGTNAEMVIGNADWMLACACSAGPAFEGGGVRHGMRATAGAIEQVRINPETLEPMILTIANRRPIGICGSGLIDLLSELFLVGIVDKRGKFNPDLPTDRVRKGDHGGEYVIAWGENTGTGRDIVLTEVDIDNLLRAKGAIYAAAELLAGSVDLTLADIEEILIAGSFGRYLRADKAIDIGLLPDVPTDRIKFLGNSSLIGARLMSLSRDMLRRADEIAKMMTYVELSVHPEYMDHYVSALFLPHTNMDAFPSVRDKYALLGSRAAKPAGAE